MSLFETLFAILVLAVGLSILVVSFRRKDEKPSCSGCTACGESSCDDREEDGPK